MANGVQLIYGPIERLCGAIYTVFLPTAVQLGDVKQQANAFRSTLRLMHLVVGPFCLGAAAVATEILTLLPPKWADLAPLLRVYAVTALVLPVNYLSLAILVAHGRAAALFRTAVAMIPVCWLGAALGAWSGSVLAMVIAWAFAIVVGASVTFYFAWRQIGLGGTRLLITSGGPLLASLLMAAAVIAVVHLSGTGGTRTGLLIGVATGVAVYGGLLGTTMRGDLTRVAALFRRSFARRASALPG
jgi:O-antigen/teichoic acid export membrane protein